MEIKTYISNKAHVIFLNNSSLDTFLKLPSTQLDGDIMNYCNLLEEFLSANNNYLPLDIRI